MRPIMPIGSVVIYDGEKKINMWSNSVVPHVWGVKRFRIEDEKAIYPRNTFDSKNSVSNFQKMLEIEMAKLNSEDALEKKESEKININVKASSEKNYFVKSEKETTYWNNVLARILDLEFTSELGRLCVAGGDNGKIYNLDSMKSSICGSNSVFNSFLCDFQ